MGTYYNNNGTLVPIAGRGSGVNRNDVAYVESGTTASRNYSVGQLVYVSGAMYRVKSAIQSGQTFTVGTNIEATTIGGEIQRINNDLSAQIKSKYFSYTFEQATTSGTLYWIDNTKTNVFGIPTTADVRGMAWLLIAGDSEHLFIKPNYNGSQDRLVFRPDRNNSTRLNFQGVVFYN